MMPVYRHMNSYPHQMSPQGYYFSGYGNNPHQMRMDSPVPLSCECCPSGGSTGFPMPCYGCCFHGNFPGYNGFMPYYHPQVPHHPCVGSYSNFHPVHHAIPYCSPPQGPVDHQPRYEYDKEVARNRHCSGCPNRVCDPRNGNTVKIEEQEPEIEKERSRKTVVPAQSTDFPYPIIWIPHESGGKQEHGSPSGSETQNMTSDEVKKVPERNGWFPLNSDTLRSLIKNQDRKNIDNGQKVVFPFDIDKLKSLLQGQDGEEAQNQRKGAESGQSPYPIYWIPSQGKSQDRKRGDMEAAQMQTDKGFPILKFFPLDPQANGDQTVKPKGKEGNSERTVSAGMEEKHAQQESTPFTRSEDRVLKFQEPAIRSEQVEQDTQLRTIPVKQLEVQGHKSTEQAKRSAANEPGESSRSKQSSSPPKASKLPPVCLRVDPLPKKRNGSSSSRSPSPPTRMGEPSKTSKDSPKLPASPNSKKTESDKSETKTIPVARESSIGSSMSETRSNGTKTEKERTGSEANSQEVVNKVQSKPDKEPARGNEAAKSNESNENRQKPVKKTFSCEEAAVVIQSGYRGYVVRRCEPLKKLKQMAKIREQMVDVKKRIQAIEGSTDHRNNEEEIAVVGEMVMSLLLKLDAIQGLYPSIRDIRKSLAKELLGLQEKLETLKKSRVMVQDASVAEQVKTPGGVVEEETHQTSEGQVDAGQGQLEEEQNKASDPNAEESIVPLSSSADALTACNNASSEHLVAVPEEEPQLIQISLPNQEEDVTPTSDTRDEAGRCDSDAVKGVVAEVVEEDESTAKTVPLINQASDDGKDTTIRSGEKEEVAEENSEVMKEVQQHVGGEKLSTPEGDENKDAEGVPNKLENSNGMAEACSSLPSEDNAELLELPIGVIDEEQQDLSHKDTSSEAAYGTAVEADAPFDDHKESMEYNDQKAGDAIEDAETGKAQVMETWERNNKLKEENQLLRETMQKLVEAGREQLEVISSLTGRVKSLEKKLRQGKKMQAARRRPKCGGVMKNTARTKAPTAAVM